MCHLRTCQISWVRYSATWLTMKNLQHHMNWKKRVVYSTHTLSRKLLSHWSHVKQMVLLLFHSIYFSEARLAANHHLATEYWQKRCIITWVLPANILDLAEGFTETPFYLLTWLLVISSQSAVWRLSIAVLRISYNLTHGLPACLHDSRLTCLIESERDFSQTSRAGGHRWIPGWQMVPVAEREQTIEFTQKVVREQKSEGFPVLGQEKHVTCISVNMSIQKWDLKLFSHCCYESFRHPGSRFQTFELEPKQSVSRNFPVHIID